jgi:hypothetical protein
MSLMTCLQVVKGFQVFGCHQKVSVPARNTIKATLSYSNVRWKRNLSALSLIEAIINDIYHHLKDNKGCNISAKMSN